MSTPRLRAIATVVALCAVAFVSLALPATAQTLGPFAKGQYYLGKGGTPPTLSQLAEDPRRYFASEQAYYTVRTAVAAVADQEVNSDAAWRELLLSERVRLLSCNRAQIYTAGLRADGTIGWFERECYGGEDLILVQKPDGQFIAVTSLGCLNLVRRVTPRAPAPVRRSEKVISYHHVPPVYIPALDVCGCVYLPPIYAPGQVWRLQTSSGFGVDNGPFFGSQSQRQ